MAQKRKSLKKSFRKSNRSTRRKSKTNKRKSKRRGGGFLSSNEKERNILANKGLQWSKKYSQEYYAKELINHINIFLNERN